jgi:class 3 adenylate cyclase
MFCDLVGSTALSVRFDPEDLRGIIGAYHRCVTEIAEGFGGFVARYMGDGVLVLGHDVFEFEVADGLTLIFRAASRAGARTRRGRGSVGAFTRRPTRSKPRSASRH